jgi:hypothetical protein
LKSLSVPGGRCSGKTNWDTKGGTWQVGNSAVSYHALGNKVPPKQDSINKIHRNGPLETQKVNTRDRAPLNPWPFDSHKDVKPTNCHSHNDYEQDIPLWSAMSAGCIGIEADVHFYGGDLLIGHILPKILRTLKAQYLEPLKAILDHNNSGKPGDVGLYPASPSQSIVLLVDFKTSDARTLYRLNEELEPLRHSGYLSRVEKGKFVERQITVVVSGSASFDQVTAAQGGLNWDIFYDAKVDEFQAQYTANGAMYRPFSSKYNNTNSYYASADFRDAIGNPKNVQSFTAEQRNKTLLLVNNAHAIGLKVRYCKQFPHPASVMFFPLEVQEINGRR